MKQEKIEQSVNASKKRMVIIGGGFAGLNFLKKLDTRRWHIVLVDRNNYHSFPPLFYQVASSGLDPGSISFPLRREMRRKHMRGVDFHLGDVKVIDSVNHCVTTQYETIEYDKLIIAAGTTNNFFSIPDLEKYVYTLKSTTEAIRCRNDILERLERAALITDPDKRRKLLSFTIIGGGPAGVEIAGALGEMKRYILKREYPALSIDDVTVTLVEGTDRLLRTMSEQASREVLEYMNHLMVNVKLNKTMKKYDNNIVCFSDGEEMYSEMVIWTAGVTAEPFKFEGQEPDRGPGNRFIVDDYAKVSGVDDIYALGDISICQSDSWPRGCPQVAQVAIQQAKNLAHNFNSPTHLRAFKYKDKGSMATVGRNRAVADLKHIHIYGRPAWFAWMLIHLMSLLGMRNKLTVLITWIWAYFTYTTSLRLLLLPTRFPLRSRWGER